MTGPFPRDFYERDPREVAPDLLGTLLVHGDTTGTIIETEAYLAEGDPAAHAARGKTPRTAVLFGPAGHAYVYRTRAHHCLNVVVQKEGVPGCVLIRAVAPVTGIAAMHRRRGDVPERRLADGPAKLCQAFAIGMRHYGVDLTTRDALAILDDGARPGGIRTGPRVGISVARTWPLRYRSATRPG